MNGIVVDKYVQMDLFTENCG